MGCGPEHMQSVECAGFAPAGPAGFSCVCARTGGAGNISDLFCVCVTDKTLVAGGNRRPWRSSPVIWVAVHLDWAPGGSRSWQVVVGPGWSQAEGWEIYWAPHALLLLRPPASRDAGDDGRGVDGLPPLRSVAVAVWDQHSAAGGPSSLGPGVHTL